MEKLDLLMAIEQIVKLSKGSELSEAFFDKAKVYTNYVSEKLHLTREQSVLMALFVDNSSNVYIRICDFASFLHCRTARIIRYMHDIDILEKRELILCSRQDKNISYRVPTEVIEAIEEDNNFEPKDLSNLTCSQLFQELDEIFQLRNDDELTYEHAMNKVLKMLENNKQLIFVKKILDYEFTDHELMFALVFCHLFVNNEDNYIGFNDLDFLYDDKHKYLWTTMKYNLESEQSALQKKKLIEYSNRGGVINKDFYRVTPDAKSALFSELNIVSINARQECNDIIKTENIIVKNLFFDKDTEKQVTEFRELLEDRRYREIRKRLKTLGLRYGFTCLFYGDPGTGKTETVLQLAHQTGRDIMQVDISGIKSAYVGESEKNIKSVFNNYRQMVKERPMTPILLFNEADAIIGRRQEIADRAAEKMENTIQNIILQEMETLDGILIATTNLAQSMDKAFERRFLYKIKFIKPTVEARIAIWHEMIPSLSENETRTLATLYNFSGGEIENIARHYTINNVLHGENINNLDILIKHCDGEQIKKDCRRKIGFA